MQRRPQRDPVTPEMRETVILRDMAFWKAQENIWSQYRPLIATRAGCIAVVLDPSTSGPCSGPLTLDHVKDAPRMGKRAPSDPEHLVTICLGHHVETRWATSHRPLLRWYLKKHYGADS
jgi:hypothetical protein